MMMIKSPTSIASRINALKCSRGHVISERNPSPQHRNASPKLHALLDEAKRRFSLEYDDFLSSHLAHGLIALERLGASQERLREYYDHYVKKLEPRELPAGEVNSDNWRKWKGKRRYMVDFIEMFQREVEDHGVEKTLIQYIPELQEGVCGSAFHCLIETGYALMVDRADLLADGLGYWAHSFYSLGRLEDDEAKLKAVWSNLLSHSPNGAYSTPCPPSPRSPPFTFGRYLPDSDSPYAPPPPLEYSAPRSPRLLEATDCEKDFIETLASHSPQLREMMDIEKREGEGFQPFLHRVRNNVPMIFSLSSMLVLPEDPTQALGKLAWIISHVYATSPERFFLLHGVTSLHALHSIVHWLPSDVAMPLIKYFWKALVATYLIEGLPPVKLSFEDERVPDDQTWEAISSKAILTDEEHIPKLVMACQDFEEWYGTGGDDVYRVCASKCVNLFSLSDPKREPHFIF